MLTSLALLTPCAASISNKTALAAENQIPFERGLEKIRLELNAARTGLSALCVAAHPGDEDGATAVWLRRVAGAEVHLCFATRGEGGQNANGPEPGMDLAVLRTRETEAAAGILGAQVWHLNLPDFGHSRTAMETFDEKKHWRHEEALERLVMIIRVVKPDLLFSNHDPKGKDHGHHQATGELVVKAFSAAADPGRFPHQLSVDGLKTWTVSKLYLRRDASPAPTLTIPVGRRDPDSGYSPAEIAAWALSKHTSQGLHSHVPLGEPLFRRFESIGAPGLDGDREASIPEGLSGAVEQEGDTGLTRIEQALKGLAGPPDEGARSILLALKEAQAAVPRSVRNGKESDPVTRARRQRRVAHLSQAATIALGLRIETQSEDEIVAPDENTSIRVRIANTGPLPFTLRRCAFSAEAHWEPGALALPETPLAPEAFLEGTAAVKATEQAYPTYPPARYLQGRFQSPNPLRIESEVEVETEAGRVTFSPHPHPVAIDLAPAYEAFVEPDPALIFDDSDREDVDLALCSARLTIVNHRRKPWKLFAQLSEDPRLRVRMEKASTFDFTREEQTLGAPLRFMADVGLLNRGDLIAKATLWTAAHRFETQPSARFRRVPLKLPTSLQVGFVQTCETATWDALQGLARFASGLTLENLDAQALREKDLRHFHTIILDIRATPYRPDVRLHRDRLLAYMRGGGNLVCLYHKDFDWNAQTPLPGSERPGGKGGGGEIAPYPIVLSSQRVADEQAEIVLLQPTHPLLTKPNKIWERDFAGWVQERGVHFPIQWDSRYLPLLSCHDPGEAPLSGGLLVAQVGDGSFIYTSFLWNRQLRAGVPGAYRFLANLIAYPCVRDATP